MSRQRGSGDHQHPGCQETTPSHNHFHGFCSQPEDHTPARRGWDRSWTARLVHLLTSRHLGIWVAERAPASTEPSPERARAASSSAINRFQCLLHAAQGDQAHIDLRPHCQHALPHLGPREPCLKPPTSVPRILQAILSCPRSQS